MTRRLAGALMVACLAPAAAHATGANAPSTANPPLPTTAVPLPLDRLFEPPGASAAQVTIVDPSDADPAPPPTAVYDIMAHVVVMPDGARLEAHSGLRDRADDPRFVAERMRGPTPPALYALEPRRRSFHGVAALRLLPVTGDVFGRTGLLAHTYMLHGRPESNGCVVFRDYGAFLQAFRDGRIKRLRVVPSVGDAGDFSPPAS